jgi:hypothetical protein
MPEAPDDPDQRLGGHDHVGDMLDADNPKVLAQIMDMVDALAKERDDYLHTLRATITYLGDEPCSACNCEGCQADLEEARIHAIAALKRWNRDPKEG